MMKRGDVYYADLSPVIGSEQDGLRPVLVVQDDRGNFYSPTTVIVPLTTVQKKVKMPTHIPIQYSFLRANSFALAEQVRTVDKARLLEYLGHISMEDMRRINRALCVSLGIGEVCRDEEN